MWDTKIVNILTMQLSPPSCDFLALRYLRSMFSHTLNLCSILMVKDQDSHPYKIAIKATILYLNLYVFRWDTERSKYSELNGNIHVIIATLNTSGVIFQEVTQERNGVFIELVLIKKRFIRTVQMRYF
jgi:hypothetical protein